MGRHKLIGLITITIMVFALCGGLTIKPAHAVIGMQFVESQLTLNNADQQNPDIYQYGLNHFAVVWQDNRNGNWDIYMYYQNYLGNGNWDVQWDNRITANSGNNLSPKIYNDTIVYQSNRNGNWDIYAYNITSKVEIQITNNTAAQQNPAIDGNHIVWQDNRNGNSDIYMYDLTTQTEQRVTTSGSNYDPSISGNRIAYIRDTPWGVSSHPNIYYYDRLTGVEVQLAMGTNSMHFQSSVIDESRVAWTQVFTALWIADNDYDILMRDVITGAYWQTDAGFQQHPDISGNWIVYQDYNQAYWNIKLYDFSSGVLYQATNTLGHQINPAISTKYANFIVYQDDRSGHWHIYLTAFWSGVGGAFPPAQPITPSRVLGLLQEFKSRIGDVSQIPTSDFAGANDKVKENRRNAMLNQLDSALASIEAAANTQDLTIRSKYLQSAIDQLNDLIGKLDGWSLRGSADVAGSGFTPDWITSPLYLDQTVRSCRNDLQTLLNGIA